ncbi:DUF1491 family protein [Hyphococcus sp. DH-69]|uniref:DUF1491 family protein n=1 Tax=Hyphococcus formosus TaxID=3143534 RepID=UPI00398AD60D
MIEPRLKTEIRVSAHLRRAQAGGAFATIVRKGDPDAGAVAVKLFIARGDVRLYIQSRDLDGNPIWREPFSDDPETDDIEAKIDRWIEKESAIDPDIWVVEIEDREGRAFLE